MRALLALTITALLALLLAGCGGGSLASLTETDISMDADLNDFVIVGGAPMSKNGALHGYKREVDLTTKPAWNDYSGRIRGFKSLRLEVNGQNDSGVVPPVEVPITFYVSDSDVAGATNDWAAVQASGVQALSYTVPAQATFSNTTGYQDLSTAAKAIVNDGQFWVYAITDVTPVDITAVATKLGFKVRVQILD